MTAQASSNPKTSSDSGTRAADAGHHDYLVIGAGPAGIQAAYYLNAAGLDCIVLERSAEVGSFFRHFPRHRKLLSINKVYTGYTDAELNLRWDWNSLLSEEQAPLFSQVSTDYFPDADDLVDYLERFVAHHAIDVQRGVSVSRIDRVGECFAVQSEDGRCWKCDRLIVATGMSREYRPDIPGAELCESYADVSTNPKDFINQRVLIIGKGNSAFETADNLVGTASSIHLASPRPLRLAWKTHFVGDLRAINNNVLDTYQLKSQNAVIDGEITEIRPSGKGYSVEIRYAHAHGEVERLQYDRVILCTGFAFDASCFGESCAPALTNCGRLPVQTSCWESENVPGLYFAGVLMQQRDYKRYMSAFIHGFRYNVQALVRHLQTEHHDTPWPATALTYSPRGVAQGLLTEVNCSSGIWQQPGFLANVVQIRPEQREALLLAAMPVDYALERFARAGTALLLTLEYGKSEQDPFLVERVHRSDVERADDSTFLHPVVRRYQDGALVDQHHVIEDLAAEWLEPEHVDPLVSYLYGVMTAHSDVFELREPARTGKVATGRSNGA